MIDKIKSKDWIQFYIFWELSLIKELGYEINFLKDYQKKNKLNIYIKLNEKDFKVPEMILKRKMQKDQKNVKEALVFNKNLLLENFIFPNKIKLPLFRKILEMYYS